MGDEKVYVRCHSCKELRQGIRAMNNRKKLFRVLKEELTVLGYWKNRARGNPKKGYVASKQGEA